MSSTHFTYHCDECGAVVDSYQVVQHRLEDGNEEWYCPSCADELGVTSTPVDDNNNFIFIRPEQVIHKLLKPYKRRKPKPPAVKEDRDSRIKVFLKKLQ